MVRKQQTTVMKYFGHVMLSVIFLGGFGAGSTRELSNVFGFSFTKSPELILGGKIKER